MEAAVIFGAVVLTCFVIKTIFSDQNEAVPVSKESSKTGRVQNILPNAIESMPELLCALNCQAEEIVDDENQQKNFCYKYQGYNMVINTLPGFSKYRLVLGGFLYARQEHRQLIAELCNHYNNRDEPKAIFMDGEDESIVVNLYNNMQMTGIREYDVRNLEDGMQRMFYCVNAFRSNFDKIVNGDDKNERVHIQGFSAQN
jgi:hypothetical protein